MIGASNYSGSPNLANYFLQKPSIQTVSGTGLISGGATDQNFGEWFAAAWQLDVTAAAAAAGDTLDVFVQTTIDGTNFIDMVHFTQCLGSGGAKRHIVTTNVYVGQGIFENGSALGSGAVRNLFGDQYRVRWAIVNSVAPSFTFSVSATFK